MVTPARLIAVAGVIAIASSLTGTGALASAGAHAAVSTNRTFAGYEVSRPTSHISTATVTFVVPTITCKKNSSGVGPSILIQSTVNKHNVYSDSGGGIAVTCQNKQPHYLALPIVDGTNYNDNNVPIAAGDKITLDVKYAKTTQVTLTDDTTKQVDKHSGKASVGQTAFFGDSGVEVNHHGLGLDPFTTTAFSLAKIDGRPIGKDKPQRFEWVDNHKVVLITASPISHQDQFTTRFKNSN